MASNIQSIFDSLLGSNTPAPTTPDVPLDKGVQVMIASETKRSELSRNTPSSDPFYLAAANAYTNKGSASQTELENDLKNLDPISFRVKYGDKTDEILNRYRTAESAYLHDKQAAGDRPLTSKVADSVDTAGSAFINSVTGIGANVAGLFNKKLGVDLATKFQNENTKLQGQDSPGLQSSRNAFAAEQALDSRDSGAVEQKETSAFPLVDKFFASALGQLEDAGDAGATSPDNSKAQNALGNDKDAGAPLTDNTVGKGITAKLHRVGSDTITTAKTVLTDPTQLTDNVASGVGSLFSAGFVGGGLKAIGKATLNGVLRTGAIDAENTLIPKILDASHKLEVPTALSIGATEGGGAYQQTAAQAYEQVKSRTDLTEDQKYELANRAGLMASAIQTPAAIATGTLVSKFEANPLRANRIDGLLSNAVKEGVEETTQSGIGQLAQNIGIQQNTDQTQDLTEGVGEQAALGGIGAIGSAVGVQAPGTALRTAADATKFVGRTTLNAGKAVTSPIIDAAKNVSSIIGSGIQKAASPITNALIVRGEKITEANNKASPVSDEVMRTNFDAATQDAPVVNETAKAAIQNTDASEPQKTEASSYIDTLTDAARFEEADLDNLPDNLKSTLTGSKDNFDAMQRLANVVNSSDNDQDKLNAGTILNAFKEHFNDLVNSDPEALSKIDPNSDAGKLVDSFKAVISRAQDTPNISRALRSVEEVTKNTDIQPIGDDEIKTPAGQQAARNAVTVAQVSPEKANPETNDKILFHADKGLINLTDNQKIALKNSSILVRAQQAYNLQASKDNLTPQDYVTKNILVGDQDEGNVDKKSILQHTQRIIQAYRSGNHDIAAAYLDRFGKFAQHMQNKVEALNSHFENGNGDARNSVHYQALTPKGAFVKSIKPLGVDPTKQGSIRFAQRVGVEASTVSKVYNDLVDILPALKGHKVDTVPLVQDLNGHADEIAQKFKDKTNEQPIEQPIQETPEVAPKAEPESEVPAEPSTVEETPIKEIKNEPEKVDEDPAVEQVEQKASTDIGTKEEKVQDNTNTNDQVEDKPEVKDSIKEVYSDLNDQSSFTNVFNLPASPKTRTIAVDEPLRVVTDALEDQASLSSFAGEEVASGYTDDIASAYSDYLDLGSNLIKIMQANLTKFLAEPYSKKDSSKGTKQDNIKTLLGFARGQALHIMNSDGSYNQELIENAALAGMQWLLDARKAPVLDDDDISELFDIPRGEVPDGLAKRVNAGLGLIEAKRSLASKIKSYWGLNSSNEAPLNIVEGIPESIAAEVMRALQEAKLLNVDEFYLNNDGTMSDEKTPELFKTINVYQLKAPTSENPIHKFPDVIEKTVLTSAQSTNYIGKAPTIVSDTQLRNPTVENTNQQKEAIKAEQNTEHYVNQPIVDLYNKLGIDNILKIFGAGDTDNRALNINYRKSLEGQNLTIRSAFDSLQSLMQEVIHRADIAKVDVDQMPIHYDYNFTRVSRMQMLGKDNPQASKLMREAILPTRSTIDLSSETSDSFANFSLAMAQALGVKINNISKTDSLVQLSSILSNDLQKPVEVLRDFLNGKKFDANILAGNDLTFAGLHALTEYARYLNSSPEEKSKFTTSLYVEADGVTNGPINAMVLMTPGRFKSDWFRNVAKGGLFFGQNMTMNEQRQNRDSNDLYQTTTNELSGLISQIRSEASDDPNKRQRINSLFGLMDLFFGKDLSFKDGNLELTRGIAKNPLTITIYGSGSRGIAAKLTEQLVEGIYEKMSNLAQVSSDNAGVPFDLATAFFGDPKDIADIKFNQFKNSLTDLTGRKLTNVDPIKFKLNSEELKNLQDNMLKIFINPMREAIRTTVGPDLMNTVDVLRKATQVQSIFYQYAYQREVARTLESKQPNEFLSQKELDGIREKLSHLAPLIKTPTQNILITGSEESDIGAKQFGNSLDDRYRTPAYVYGPSDAGVSGIPFMTIAMGDGQMMQNISTMENAPTKTLKVFDGMHLSLDQLESGSQVANQAVFDSWQGNPIQSVHNTYSEFMKDLTFKDITDEQAQDLAKALFDPATIGEGFETKDLFNEMTSLNEQLDRMSQEIEARHQVMKDVHLSVDQMAGVGASHENAGIPLIGSEDEILNKLNELYQDKLNTIRDTNNVSEDISSDLQKVGRAHKSGVRILSFTATKNLFRAINIPTEQHAVMGDIMRSLSTKGYKFIYGSIEQIKAYADLTGHEIPSEADLIGSKGFTVFNDKTAYLVNPSSETLVHEMIHVATYEKVSNYYDGSVNDPTVSASIKRIEALQTQFLGLSSNLNEVGPKLRNAFNTAKLVIQDYLNAGNKAAALNEFMAWGLSNSDLIRLEKRTETNRLFKMTKDLFDSIKRIFFGRKQITEPKGDMFSNLRFNTNIIVRSNPTVNEQYQNTILYQNSPLGRDRLKDIEEAFVKRIGIYLKADPIDRTGPTQDAILAAVKLSQSVNTHGFPMNPQETSTFRAIVAGLATQAHIDSNSLNRAQELYASVTKNLKVEDFMDPNSPDPDSDRHYAQEKYNSVVGNNLTLIDRHNKSSLLPVFLALANVNDEFRKVLSKMESPKTKQLSSDSLDNILANVGNYALDTLGARMSGENNAKNIRDAIDGLTNQIVTVAQDRASLISQASKFSSNIIDTVNNTVVDLLGNISDKLVDNNKNVQADKNATKLKRNLASMGALAGAIVSEKNGKLVAEGVMSAMNRLQGFKPFHDFVNDLVGRSSTNKGIYDMIKQTRSMVSQDRQQYREHLPQIIASKFSRKLTDQEWTHLFHGMGKTDIAALASKYSSDEIAKFLSDPKQVSSEINKIESNLQSADPKSWNSVQKKAKQLANFMNTFKPESNLLRNAYAVSHLFGEGIRSRKVKDDYIENVDHLTSLYALENVAKSTKDVLTSLVQSEAEGMRFLNDYMVGQRVEEQRKADAPIARSNAYKGYIPTEARENVSLIIEQDSGSNYSDMLKKSFERVAPYGGSSLEHNKQSKGYYFAPVNGRANFDQGVLQNVRTTASGVDLASGFTYGMPTAGRITDPVEVKRIARTNRNDTGSEPLLPVYDANGSVTAYERSVDPIQMDRLNRETDLSKLIGIWRGRQVEEIKAQIVNEGLIDKLHDMYENDLTVSSGNQDQYINIFDQKELDKDPVLRDATALFTPATRNYITKVFGDSFYVRRDMLNDAFGYRRASIGDLWTGNSRWSQETLDNVRNLVIGAIGNKAYQYLVNAEKILQNAVTDAKVAIVVKSVIVPAGNLVSNIYQLAARGVPVLNTVKAMPKKLAEIESYAKSAIRLKEIEAELRATEGDVIATRKLQAEEQSINDAHKRLSIYPLIQAGEFNSISDGDISREDVTLFQGRMHDYIETLVSKLPDKIRTAGRYAIIAKDTSLFHGLQKSVEYGDFLAKTILYDDLINRQKKTHEEALAQVTEEFINYDRLPGRFRSTLERNGLLWFYSFKIRSSKIAVSMIRNNPVHAMFSMMMPHPTMFGSIGLPIDDNIFSQAEDGKLGRSMGPAQGFNSFSLNPWMNLIR